MADDPMANVVNSEGDAYGVSAASGLLRRLFEHAEPLAAAHATELFLKRLVVLEMVLEKEYKMEVSAEELERFLADNHPEVQAETAKLAQLFYGKIAGRPGG